MLQRSILFVILMGCLPPRIALSRERPRTPWPPPPGPARLIIDTGAANEVDAQYALVLALGFQERFQIEGLISAPFGEAGGSSGIEKPLAEIRAVLDKAGMFGRYPVERGAAPPQHRYRPPCSEVGIDFIIERARGATPDSPLWHVLLRPATDAAAALLKAPEILDRLVVFWHGHTQWPVRCWNFNSYNDVRAARGRAGPANRDHKGG